MPANPHAPDWYVEEYETQVRLKYQARGGILRQFTTPPARIEGSTMYFPLMGELAAYKVTRNDQSNPDAATMEFVPLTWDHYEVQYQLNQVDLDKTTVGMVSGYAQATSRALGRKTDRVVLATLEALALPAGQIFGDYTTSFTLEHAANMADSLFDSVEDDEETAICMMPHGAFSQLTTFKEFANSQYVGDDLPFVKKKQVKLWRNVIWFAAPKRAGKPDPYFNIPGANQLDIHMWLPSAVGSGGLGDQIRSYVTWDNKVQGGAWDHKNVIGLGAKVLQEIAVRRFKWKSDSALDYT